jgi:hypothetical protein
MFIPFHFFNKLSFILTSKSNKKQAISFQKHKEIRQVLVQENIHKRNQLHPTSRISNCKRYKISEDDLPQEPRRLTYRQQHSYLLATGRTPLSHLLLQLCNLCKVQGLLACKSVTRSVEIFFRFAQSSL